MRTNIIKIVLSAAAFGVLSAGAIARADEEHAAHHVVAQPADAAQALPSEGEVRKVDRESGKLTLRHGPLTNLDMPAMTMVFAVSDPRFLDGLNEGDKVRFTADRKDGKLVVTAIERAN
ncbi:copper-binding protein [Variovorax sp. Sphag1AA]|uniref:copper-binding protein n=1 Tax=Variovorax sp. Sphag1AA TaxID=2587027 RepID=UPI001607466A|nr:copper-binding protein [Variovorax sp. Sphag1AA]MBB3181821.1 Cu/Ag efflux protein CusF [Variovorax sp. Sphag1AA]